MSKPDLDKKECKTCGELFSPWKKSSKFCSRSCYHEYGHRKKRKKSSWWVNKKGYVEGRVWIDPNTQISIKRHRFVMEKHLGRKLKDNEDVHHINGDKTDNSIGNLKVINHSEHTRITNRNRDYKTGYKMDLIDEERERRSNVLKQWHKKKALNKAGVQL